MESLLSDDGMKCLSSLHTLFIGDCNSLVRLPTNGIRELQKLDNFFIWRCEKLNLQSDDQHRYSEGQRESGLRRVSFAQMPMMETLPSWLLCGANALKEIVISGCPNLTALMPEPLLDGLKCLLRIEIINCPQLVGRCMKCLLRIEDWNKISHVPDIYMDGRKVVKKLQTRDGSQQMLVRDADLSGSDGADLSGIEGVDSSGIQGADLSGIEGADLSGNDGADLSGIQGADLSGIQGADLSGNDGADLSGSEGDEAETITLERARTIVPQFKKILVFSFLVLCLGLFGKLFS